MQTACGVDRVDQNAFVVGLHTIHARAKLRGNLATGFLDFGRVV